jgi:hypothetical protein
VAELSQAERDKLTIDHEKAEKAANEYLVRTKAAIDSRMKHLILAMNQFGEFLNLKPKETTSFWDVAFAVIDLVPGVRLAKILANQTQAATLALEIAKATGNKFRRAAVVKTVAGAGGKVVKAVNTVKGVKDKLKDPVENVQKVGGAIKEALQTDEETESLRSKHDAQRKAIQALIEDENAAIEAWDTTTDAELEEYANRLAGHKSPNSPPTLVEFVTRVLQPVPKLTDEQLEEVETLYLWEMIGAWARKNTRFTVTRTTIYYHNAISVRTMPGGTDTSLTGFNSEQEAEIYRLFGADARRGKIFNKPPILKAAGGLHMFAGLQLVPTVQEDKKVTRFSPSAKL